MWRLTGGADERQRSLPLLVSSRGSGPMQLAKRFDAYDYSRCRRCLLNSASSHDSRRFKPRGYPPATFFTAAFGAAASQEAEAAPCQGLGGPGSRRWLGVLLRSGSSLDSLQSLNGKTPLRRIRYDDVCASDQVARSQQSRAAFGDSAVAIRLA